MLDINKYKRNDVYLEEVNNSVIPQVPAQESIINFVPGFSKKGRFNAPALIKTTSDRSTIYGPIDRSLEIKDSWFHRTIDVALQTGPVWGLSLLNVTDDDKLGFSSLSLAPQFDNSNGLNSKYSNFFNKSGFWYKDTEAFINTANSTNKILHFTNMSDKKISVFVFKSPITGYNETLESWYGDKTKVPTYLYPTDLVSDYLVRVIVLAGDWSNYKNLANDTIFSKYFNADGLNKNVVDSFLNEKTVNVLGKYDVSLIPFFRDRSNKNIFIESVLNQYTDKTGLFCAFDIEKFETELPNGLVDLSGHTLLYNQNKPTNPFTKESIDFLSYKNTIIETTNYTESTIDRLGNVVSLGLPSIASNNGENARTAYNSPGYVTGLIPNRAALNANTGNSVAIEFVATNAYAIYGNNKLNLTTYNDTTVLPLPGTSGTPATTTTSYNYFKIVYVLGSDGVIKKYVSNCLAASNTLVTNAHTLSYTFSNTTTWLNSDIVLGYIVTSMSDTATTTTGINNKYMVGAVANTGYVSPLNISNITYTTSNTVSGSTLTLNFTNIAQPTKTDIENWRSKQLFDAFVALKSDSRACIVIKNGVKIPISAFNWTDNSLSTNGNKYITLTLNTNIYGSLTDISTSNSIMIYGIDDEFLIGTTGITASNSGSSTTGIASKYSKFYSDFYNGKINTTDYFYVKVLNSTIRFVRHTDGYSYLIMPTANVDSNFTSGYKFWIPGNSVNKGLFTVIADGVTSVSGLTLTSETAFKLLESVTTAVSETNDIYNYTDKIYLKIYTINDVLKTEFYADKEFLSTYTIAAPYISLNKVLNIYSDLDSYEQTLEIESVIADNKISVNGSRYSEIIIGDYLEAYVDYTALQAGEIPKSFTRIIAKKKVGNNVEITTDSKISIQNYNNDLQTKRYTKIDDYVTSYKTISLDPFIVRASAMPDGTEERQSLLLNILAKDTAMFEAIVNKNTFNYRYLIDSTGLGLTEFSKQQLVDICGQRVATIGFINMPSIKRFKKSSSPSFTDNDGNLIVSYIKDGGNLQNNPAFLYSFAQGQGQTSVGYFTPYVQVNENGRPIHMPPAAFAANTYMRKNTTNVGGKYPYTIAAGPEDGIVYGIADVEYDFNNKELESLFEMNANPIIINRNNVFSLDNEFTAQRDIKSSLSYLHSREVLIEIENELYNLLLPYKHKFNTTGIRTEIKRKADILLQKYKDRNALYEFYNIIDETNNTKDIIDNAMGLLQTYVEIVKGMGVVVGIISIEGTNTINSSGFNPNGQQTI